MSLLRVSVPLILEPAARPAPEAIASWFEQRIHRYEADTKSPDRVTDISVTLAPHGFDVHIESTFQTLPRILPLALFGVAGVIIQGPLPRFAVSGICFGLLGAGFVIAWLRLRSFTRGIAEDVRESYSTVPPAPAHRLGTADSAPVSGQPNPS